MGDIGIARKAVAAARELLSKKAQQLQQLAQGGGGEGGSQVAGAGGVRELAVAELCAEWRRHKWVPKVTAR